MLKDKVTKEAHVYFPATVFAKLKKMAMANRRSMSAEIVIAVEDRIESQKLPAVKAAQNGRVK